MDVLRRREAGRQPDLDQPERPAGALRGCLDGHPRTQEPGCLAVVRSDYKRLGPLAHRFGHGVLLHHPGFFSAAPATVPTGTVEQTNGRIHPVLTGWCLTPGPATVASMNTW